MRLIYGGVSFFLWPQVDAENRGWGGGAEAIHSASPHRFLVVLRWLSAPGWFAAESLLDSCVLLGLAHGPEISTGAVAVAKD